MSEEKKIEVVADAKVIEEKEKVGFFKKLWDKHGEQVKAVGIGVLKGFGAALAGAAGAVITMAILGDHETESSDEDLCVVSDESPIEAVETDSEEE